MSLLYAYGITKSNISIPKELIEISNNSSKAICKEVNEEDFGEEHIHLNLQKMDWVTEKAKDHQEVLSSVNEIGPVIPLSFGIVFKSQESVREMIQKSEKEFEKVFERIGNKKEWGLKLYYDPNRVNSYLKANSVSIKKIIKKLKDSTAGKKFLLKKELDELIKQESKQTINAHRKEVYEFVAQLNSKAKVLENSSKELSDIPGKNILNLAFLTEDPNKIINYADTFNIKAHSYFIKVTGPWPPYNFIES